MDKDDRLSAGWTMEQYEHQYRQAFAEAAKVADPTLRAGKPIPDVYKRQVFKLFLLGITKNLCQCISKINNPYLFSFGWSDDILVP